MDPKEKLKFIGDIEQFEQRSKEWFSQRSHHLTSSDAATAIGINPYQKPVELLFKKCNAGKPFTGNVATLHGQKYEDEAIEKYCELMGKKNYDFGLIGFESVNSARTKSRLDDFIKKYPHIDLSFLAGSPDGVAIDKRNMEDLILLEVKCPYRRGIKNGYCPEYYLPQVQLNMAILDIDKADFIEYIPANFKNNKYPKLNIVRIHRDHDWFEQNVPILHKQWQDILEWRQKDITTHPDYEQYAYKPKPKVYPLFVDDKDNRPQVSSDMFRTVSSKKKKKKKTKVTFLEEVVEITSSMFRD